MASLCDKRDLLTRIGNNECKSTHVNLCDMNLTEFPEELYQLQDSLEILNLGNNHIKTLPDDMYRFSKLRVLFFGSNDFEIYPKCLGKVPSLYMISFKGNKLTSIPEESLHPNIGWLILTDNMIKSLPKSIGNLSGLRKCMLANNQLTELPSSLSKCKELELIRISRNLLAEIPEWLFRLPKLTWLAYAGNPCSMLCNSVLKSTIRYDDLKVGEMVGKGASGFVHKATWKNKQAGTASEENDNIFALKLFRGTCTSDGHPEDEVLVSCTLAELPRHPSLLTILGCIVERLGTEEAITYGIAYPLLPLDCKVLGNPPSFESVTRDVFCTGAHFSMLQTLRILIGIASAMEHLHSAGVMHGDVYAHNINIHLSGEPVLVDFGASTVYTRQKPDDVSNLCVNPQEGLEVRAFGCLIEELLPLIDNISNSDSENMKIHNLRDLCSNCMTMDIYCRPTFKHIYTMLKDM